MTEQHRLLQLEEVMLLTMAELLNLHKMDGLVKIIMPEHLLHLEEVMWLIIPEQPHLLKMDGMSLTIMLKRLRLLELEDKWLTIPEQLHHPQLEEDMLLNKHDGRADISSHSQTN